MRLARAPSALCGALGALYLLTGRWTFARLSGAGPVDAPFGTEVRFWVVLALVGTSLAVAAPPVASARRRGGAAVVLLFALFWYLLATAAWAPDPELAAAKAYDVVLLAAASLALGRALAGADADLVRRALWSGLLVGAGTLAGVALATLAATGATGERLAVLGGGPNAFGRLMGLLALAALFFWARRGLAWVFMPLASVAFVLVLLSGSRGSFLALLAAIGAFAALEARRAWRLAGAALVAAAAFSVAAIYTPIGRAALETFDVRIRQRLVEEQYAAGRTELYQAAWTLAMKAPVFGDGLAAFPARKLGVYPHNVFLEAFCEAGVVGVALLVAVLLAAAWAALRRGDPPDRAAAAGVAFALVASQFSGDLYDSRALFAFVVLATVRPRGDAAGGTS